MLQIDLHKYTWAIYPGVVVVGILASSTLLLSPNFWQNLFNTAAAVQEQSTSANSLQAKLRALESVNIANENDNLSFLLSILPASKQIPVLLSQLQSAAVDTGTILEGYRFEAGDISATESAGITTPSDNLSLSAAYTVADISALRNLINNFENRTPLLAVKEVHYESGRANFKIDALWSPLTKLTASDNAEPLVSVGSGMARIRGQFASIIAVVKDASSAADQSVSANPF